jgi:hypothetical protein
MQRITLTLAQDGSTLDWKPCTVSISRPRVAGALAITPEVAHFVIDRCCNATISPPPPARPLAAAAAAVDVQVVYRKARVAGGWVPCAARAF